MAKKKSIKKSKSQKKFSQNYWTISTAILAILLATSLLMNMETETKISPEEVGQKVLEFAKSQGANAELLSVSDEGSLYEIVLSIKGEDGASQDAPVYATKDGKNLVPYLYPLTTETEKPAASQTETEKTPKSDNPSIGLYIWSYCPYGVTALEPFSEVASLLGGDFKVFLYYAGHGDFETQQNKIQACIQDSGSDQYWNYAKTFASKIYEKCYGDAECDLTESTALMDSLGINSEEILSCVETSGEALLEEHYNAAKTAGVTGSPSLVINGVKVSTQRTAEAYKLAVCSSYNTAPEECAETLSTEAAAATGSC